MYQKRKSYGSVLPDHNDFRLPAPTENGGDTKPPTTINVETDSRQSIRQIWSNLYLANAGIFFLFTGYSAVALFQSSINSEHSLGVAALAIKSGCMIFGSVFAHPIIHRFGCKTTLTVGNLFFVSFIPANFYPSWFTMIPFAMLAGFGCTMKDVGHKVYLARLAHRYAELTNTNVDRVNSRLFVLYVISMMSGCSAGSLIPSLIMSSASATGVNFDDSRFSVCGSNYCNQNLPVAPSLNQTETGSESDDFTMTLVLGFCTISGLLSVFLFFLLDSLEKLGISSNKDEIPTSPLTILKNNFQAMTDPKIVLIIPMAIALQSGDSFLNADFTKAYITCSLGVGFIGYVLMWNGLTGAVATLLLGWFNNQTMRCFPVVCATILQICSIMGLFYWVPSHTSVASNYWALAIFSTIFIFGTSIRHFISPVLVSVVFKDNLETAFSVFYLWTYVTGTVFYGWNNFVCISSKLYFMLAVITISFIGYIGMEVLVYRKSDFRKLNYNRILADKVLTPLINASK